MPHVREALSPAPSPLLPSPLPIANLDPETVLPTAQPLRNHPLRGHNTFSLAFSSPASAGDATPGSAEGDGTVLPPGCDPKAREQDQEEEIALSDILDESLFSPESPISALQSSPSPKGSSASPPEDSVEASGVTSGRSSVTSWTRTDSSGGGVNPLAIPILGAKDGPMAPASAPTGRGDGTPGTGQQWRSGIGRGRFTVDSGGGSSGTVSNDPSGAGTPAVPLGHPMSYPYPVPAYGMPMGVGMPHFPGPNAAFAASMAEASLLGAPAGTSGPSSLPANFGWAGPGLSAPYGLGPHGLTPINASWAPLQAPLASEVLPTQAAPLPSYLHDPSANAAMATSGAPPAGSNPSESPLDLFRPVSGFHGLLNLPGSAPTPRAPGQAKAKSLLTDMRPKDAPTRSGASDLQSIAAELQKSSEERARQEQWRSPAPESSRSPNPNLNLSAHIAGGAASPPGGASGVFSPTESFFGSFQGALNFDTPAPLDQDPFASLATSGVGSPAGSFPSLDATGSGFPSSDSVTRPDPYEVSPELIGLANAALELRDPVAASVWKIYGEANAKVPTDKEIEDLAWRITGMGLGELRKRIAEFKEGAEPTETAPTAEAPTNEALPPEALTIAAAVDLKGKGPARVQQESAIRAESPERGRRGRSQGTASKTQTPESDIM